MSYGVSPDERYSDTKLHHVVRALLLLPAFCFSIFIIYPKSKLKETCARNVKSRSPPTFVCIYMYIYSLFSNELSYQKLM